MKAGTKIKTFITYRGWFWREKYRDENKKYANL